MDAQQPPKGSSGFDKKDLSDLYRFRPNPEGFMRMFLYVVGIALTPITLTGSLLGYSRAYERIMYPLGESPVLHPLRPIVKVAMVIGAILIWVFILVICFLILEVFGNGRIDYLYLFFSYAGINLLVTLFVMYVFRGWRNTIEDTIAEQKKFGTARLARPDELGPYRGPKGLYVGGGYTFSGKGHLLTVAGTRGGKGTNLIIPNLLGAGGYEGSWVVIDPKGENAAITARFQQQAGRKVVILNPWNLLHDRLGDAQTYNPLDLLSDPGDPNVVDDVQMIAEMIVPISSGGGDKFFSDLARSIVAGLLLHLVTMHDMAQENDGLNLDGSRPDPVTLTTIWEWVRSSKDQWAVLIGKMLTNDHELFGNVVRRAGHEIETVMAAGDKTWGSIIATVLQNTDFLKSPSLQQSMKSGGFDPDELAGGNVALYVIIPADKLQSHGRWLRLVTTTTMRAVVRNSNKRVTFLLDEFSALGYLPEIETALSTYAGFNVTVWPILQSLIQLQANYSKTWETFVGNSTIRQFFSINDNFTANYLSVAIGMTSHLAVRRTLGIPRGASANPRLLFTPDELRRGSGENIFAFIEEKPVTYFKKQPYYTIPELNQRADKNPYTS